MYFAMKMQEIKDQTANTATNAELLDTVLCLYIRWLGKD